MIVILQNNLEFYWESDFNMKKIITNSLLIFYLFNSLIGQNCAQQSTGFIPVADLGKSTFNGFVGGKYPDGNNDIPLLHFNKGMEMCADIKPLNAEGIYDTVNGKIGFMVLGFSTAAMTGRFVRSIYESQNPDDKLEIIIGAQGGKDINSMTNASANYWLIVDSIVKGENMTLEQIQIIWISSGDILSYQQSFPEQCYTQIEKYQLMLQEIKNKFPNVRAAFISDRTYAGYIGDVGEGPQELKEPSAYYNSWTVKWLIEKQINGEKGFTQDEIPFIDWGPSLWTDGVKGNKNGYTWNCEDSGKGGIHPSSKGRMKEASMVYLYFKQHPYLKTIFANN